MQQRSPQLHGGSTDYYKMILHKLWRRMLEQDSNTKLKAFYIFHRIAVSLDGLDHKEFLKRYYFLKNQKCLPSNHQSKSMTKSITPKSNKYFNMNDCIQTMKPIKKSMSLNEQSMKMKKKKIHSFLWSFCNGSIHHFQRTIQRSSTN